MVITINSNHASEVSLELSFPSEYSPNLNTGLVGLLNVWYSSHDLKTLSWFLNGLTNHVTINVQIWFLFQMFWEMSVWHLNNRHLKVLVSNVAGFSASGIGLSGIQIVTVV